LIKEVKSPSGGTEATVQGGAPFHSSCLMLGLLIVENQVAVNGLPVLSKNGFLI